jgi:glucose-fructose oxidoreductase
MVSQRGSRGRRKVRYALVGLGDIAQRAVLPAFARSTRNSVLSAVVSGDPAKREKLARQSPGVRAVGYEGFDALLASGEIDAIYVALPNHLHRDYTVRAASAGVHVLCEKPLAMTADDCQQMIDAAAAGGVKLMTAYRLRFEPANLHAAELARGESLGEVRWFDAAYSQQVEKGNVRLDPERSGGPLYDIGIYCIHAARMVFGDEPCEVSGVADAGADPRFSDVPECFSGVLRFSGGRLASFTCSFGATKVSAFRVAGTKGELLVEPAFDHDAALGHRLTIANRTRRRSFPRHDQFAPELLHFSDCVLHDTEPEPSGRMGQADVRIIEALRLSAETGAPVSISKPSQETPT